MPDRDYDRILRKAYGIEVQGEALFAAAARVSRNRDRRHKWETLRDLEAHTKIRVARAIEDDNGVPTPGRWQRVSGTAVGVVAGLLPWRIVMRGVQRVAKHTTALWQRMERDADGRNAELHRYLVAHEEAQHAFARQELAGKGTDSLDAVRALIA